MTAGEERSAGTGCKPRDDHGVDHAGDDHAGCRQHDRQCRLAAHSGQPLGGPGPDRLGTDLVHCRGGDHDAADRLARRAPRHQICVSDLGGRVHPRLGFVRQRHQPHPAGDLPPAARRVRRRARPALPIGADADQPAGAARPGNRDLGHGGHAGADLRPDAGRLADPRLQLALDLLHQPAGRRDRQPRHPDLYPRDAAYASRGLRLLRLCDVEHRRSAHCR